MKFEPWQRSHAIGAYMMAKGCRELPASEELIAHCAVPGSQGHGDEPWTAEGCPVAVEVVDRLLAALEEGEPPPVYTEGWYLAEQGGALWFEGGLFHHRPDTPPLNEGYVASLGPMTRIVQPGEPPTRDALRQHLMEWCNTGNVGRADAAESAVYALFGVEPLR